MIIKKSAISILFWPILWAGNTTVLFQPGSSAVGPFPTDSLTLPDANQITGRRVNLPLPAECGSAPGLSACTDTLLLDQLDGFSVNPRITICFSDSIDPNSLRGGIRLIAVGQPASALVINQVIYDSVGKCAYAKPDAVLNQHSRYLLLVTQAVKDSKGQKLQENKEFKDCLKNKDGDAYCAALSQAVDESGKNQSDRPVSASLFTTMSATAWLEQARNFVNQPTTPYAAIPAGVFSAFDLSHLDSMVWVPQDQNGNIPQPVPLTALPDVGKVAFGLYLSPNFLNVSGPLAGSIVVTPTAAVFNGPQPIPFAPLIPPGYLPVSFHVFLPAAAPPPDGYPVVIFGHGLGDNQFGASTFIASTLAKHGFATVTIEITGHGFGPGGTVQLHSRDGGATFTVNTPGRGIAFSATGPVGPTDGCILPGPLAVRDCGRQTAVDLFSLVRTIQSTGGLRTIQGPGSPLGLNLNLNPAKLYYVGQSFGSTYGTLFHSVEPSVMKAVLNGAGGTSVDVSRLAISGRPLAAFYLATNNPSLLNVPPAPSQAFFHDIFNDNYVFRDLPAVVNNVAGALPIQAAFEVADWLGMLGDPLSYAGHLKTLPLAGVPVKSTLFQFAFGDLEVPNPTESALVRAAGGIDSSWFMRFDVAAQSHPELLGVTMPSAGALPILPHRFLSNPTIFSVPAETALALAAQQQAAVYFAGEANPDPNQFLTGSIFSFPKAPIFQPLSQVPVPLLNRLNFLQIPQ